MSDSNSATREWLLPTVVLLSLVFCIFANVAPLNTRNQLREAQKIKAQLGCVTLDKAIQKYTKNEANTKHELPNTLRDLVDPPIGSGSFLENEGRDLIDPWDKPYQMERARRSDGTEYILVKTTAPNGTLITQYGIGAKNAYPK